LASVVGSRSTRTSSRCTGTVTCWVSVTTYLRSRTRPRWRAWVPTLKLLLGAGHGVVGGRAGGVPAGGVVGAGGRAAVGAGLAVVQAVVAGPLGLLVLGQLAVGLHPGGVADLLAVAGHLDAAAGGLGVGEGHQGGRGADRAAGDPGPPGLAGLVVGGGGADGGELVAGRVEGGAALPAADGVKVGHAGSLLVAGWLVGDGTPRRWCPARGVPPSGAA
jgi:hypothetical protein